VNFRVLIFLLIFFLRCLPFIEGWLLFLFYWSHILRESLNQVKIMWPYRSYVLYNGTAIVRMFTFKNRFFTIVFIVIKEGDYMWLVMECEACKKTFTRKDNLKRHEEKCKVVFKCEECEFETPYNNSYKRHGKIRGNMFKQVHT